MDLLAIRNSPAQVSERTSRIHAALLARSTHLKQANFESLSASDLDLLYQLYNCEFFGHYLDQLLQHAGARLLFRLSKTMTSAGGKTYRYRQRGVNPPSDVYEIAVSTHLLFDNFREPGDLVIVVGIVCTSRLQALQRIMEHEIIHLAEMLVWGQSTCAGGRYQALARNIFGHEHTRHELVTTRQRAAEDQGIRGGTKVQFEFRGQRFEGIVNRIAKRATVLVPDENGMPYSDGKKYMKFYIPLEHLTVV